MVFKINNIYSSKSSSPIFSRSMFRLTLESESKAFVLFTPKVTVPAPIPGELVTPSFPSSFISPLSGSSSLPLGSSSSPHWTINGTYSQRFDSSEKMSFKMANHAAKNMQEGDGIYFGNSYVLFPYHFPWYFLVTPVTTIIFDNNCTPSSSTLAFETNAEYISGKAGYLKRWLDAILKNQTWEEFKKNEEDRDHDAFP